MIDTDLLDSDEMTWRANVTLAMRAMTARITQLESDLRASNESMTFHREICS